MKTKIFTFLAASTLAIFTACSDDSGSGKSSWTEACAEGLSEDCLVGTWTLNSISNKDDGLVVQDFSSAQGGTLEFTEDGIFHYVRSTKGSCPGSLAGGIDEKGTWTINEDGSLDLFLNKEGDCLEFMKHYVVKPSIEMSGQIATLKLNTVIFQQAENEQGNNTEVFKRSE